MLECRDARQPGAMVDALTHAMRRLRFYGLDGSMGARAIAMSLSTAS